MIEDSGIWIAIAMVVLFFIIFFGFIFFEFFSKKSKNINEDKKSIVKK